MFRKIVAGLPFSPALGAELGSYMGQLSSEQRVRRLGFFLSAFAIIIQLFILLNPPVPLGTRPQHGLPHVSSSASIIRSVEAKNLTRPVDDATQVPAKAGERIEYTLHSTNIGRLPVTIPVQQNLSDIVEYASLQDLGNGMYDNRSQTIRWVTTLKPEQSDSQKLVVQVLDTIPSTPRPSSNSKSYDCTLTTQHGNTLNVRIDCPRAKVIEDTIAALPIIGTYQDLAICVILLVLTWYPYVRTRQFVAELHILRRVHTGGIF
jgi:hypothetical protein